jgi:hypothetical protein
MEALGENHPHLGKDPFAVAVLHRHQDTTLVLPLVIIERPFRAVADVIIITTPVGVGTDVVATSAGVGSV